MGDSLLGTFSPFGLFALPLVFLPRTLLDAFLFGCDAGDDVFERIINYSNALDFRGAGTNIVSVELMRIVANKLYGALVRVGFCK